MMEIGFFDRFDEWITALALIVLMLGAWWVGWRAGASRKPFEGKEPPAEKLGDAVFTLLGLLLAFTFGMALQKHNHRREMVVSQSNAIGDFYTCASLLDDPLRQKLQDVIHSYTQLMMKGRRDLHDAALEDDLRQGMKYTNDMTDLVRQAGSGGSPFTVPLTNTLNEVTSAEASRISAVEDRLPTVVVLLLMLTSIFSVGLIGWRHGAVRTRQRLGTLVLIAICAMVVYVTLDLDQPTRGLIRVSQAPLVRLERSMAK